MAALGWLLNLGFGGSGASAPVAAETAATGGRHRRYRYPRRIMVDGKRYVVDSPADEKAILQAYISQKAQNLAIKSAKKSLERKIRLAENRIQRLDALIEAENQARIRRENDELIMVLM